MIAATLCTFWQMPRRAARRRPAPQKHRSPLFIGDAVQPWGAQTMLLALLRAECDAQAKPKDAGPSQKRRD